MRYFYDTEFIDNGRTIELISIGVAAEDGREYYAISTEFDPDRAGSWVRKHVLPKLPSPASPLWRSRRQIRADLEDFFGIDGDEHDRAVGLGRRLRPRGALPAVGADDRACRPRCRGSPANCASSGRNAGRPRMPPRPRDAHDALVDARHNLLRFQTMTGLDRRPPG